MFVTKDLDVRADAPGRWRLLAPLIWDDGKQRIEIPSGFTTDLASIPRLCRTFLDQNGRSRRCAVLHDYAYAKGLMSRAEADALFRRALASEGIGAIGRATYWLGVRTGGWIPWRNHRRRDAIRHYYEASP